MKEKATKKVQDQRLTDALGLLGSLDPVALRASAALLPGARGEILEDLAGLVNHQDPAPHLESLLRSRLANPELLARELQPLLEALRGQLADLRVRLSRLDAQVKEYRSIRAHLVQALEGILPGAVDDVELEMLVTESLDLARSPEAEASLERVLGECRTLTEQVEASVTPAPGHLVPAAGVLEETNCRMEEALLSVEAACVPYLSQLPSLVERAATLARERNHPAAADIAQVEASLFSRIHGSQAPGIEPRWRRAFDLAFGARRLDLSWSTGRELQASALRREDLPLVARVSGQLAELSGRSGDPGREQRARIEQALCTARIPGQSEKALQLSNLVLSSSKDRGIEEMALALLCHAQVMESLGRLEQAREACGQILRGTARPEVAAEVGRAALLAARIDLRTGRTQEFESLLRLSLQIAESKGDLVLYDASVATLLDWYLGQERKEDARLLARAAIERFEKTGYAERFRESARARWGASVVATW